MKRNRILLIASAVILLCTCIITGVSYALFTDSVSVTNHLQAGKLDVTLERTDLTYCILNDAGVLETVTVDADLDFTSSTANNVFGIDASGMKVVPGSYFVAKMKMGNNGNVAFTYDVSISLLEGNNALAEQLTVTVTHPNGSTTVKKLSELTNGLTITAGTMGATDSAQEFTVAVSFDDATANNSAMNKSVVFDLVVTAEQATA